MCVIARRLWTRVPADADRCLVYGPRLGRVYLLTLREATEPVLVKALGLERWTECRDIADPVDNVLTERSDFKDPAATSRRLVALYRLLHLSRYVLSLPRAAQLAARLVRTLSRNRPSAIGNIGRLIHDVEAAGRFSDCYPRTLLTAALAVTAGFSCELSIGSLAPTRKLHAWCSVDGQLPYEPAPEHYLYRPLVQLTLQPG